MSTLSRLLVIVVAAMVAVLAMAGCASSPDRGVVIDPVGIATVETNGIPTRIAIGPRGARVVVMNTTNEPIRISQGGAPLVEVLPGGDWYKTYFVVGDERLEVHLQIRGLVTGGVTVE